MGLLTARFAEFGRAGSWDSPPAHNSGELETYCYETAAVGPPVGVQGDASLQGRRAILVRHVGQGARHPLDGSVKRGLPWFIGEHPLRADCMQILDLFRHSHG